MDMLNELRDMLGPDGTDWTDAQLIRLDHDLDAMAALLVDIYLSEEGRRIPDRPSASSGPHSLTD